MIGRPGSGEFSHQRGATTVATRYHYFNDCINHEDADENLLDNSVLGDKVTCVLCIQEMHAAGILVTD